MLAIALALGAAVSWGVADYLGGIQARRHPVLTILLIGQSVGLVGVVIVVASTAGAPPGPEALITAAVAGLVATAGLALFYRALSVGLISIVTPIAATGAVVPVLAGVIQGEQLSALQLIGIVAALCGVVLAARELNASAGDDGRVNARLSALLAVAAGACFGFGLVGLDHAAEEDALWTIQVFRGVNVAVVVLLALALRHRPRPGRADAPVIATLGALDVLGFALFAVASTKGLLSVVAVIAAMYPLIAISLAYAWLGERLGSGQRVGVVLALLGVALISGA